MKKKAKEFLKLQKKKKIQLDGTTEGTVAAIKNEMYNKIIIEIGDQEYDPNEICEIDIEGIIATIKETSLDSRAKKICIEVVKTLDQEGVIKFKETNE